MTMTTISLDGLAWVGESQTVDSHFAAVSLADEWPQRQRIVNCLSRETITVYACIEDDQWEVSLKLRHK